ncbi:hypothetical protein A2U01_0059088, partial [Trifolium medium]|nr:hypothetical protein [Trifolium medium]
MLSEHPLDVSALVASKGPQPPSSIFYCEYCKKPWHNKDMCIKLHGKQEVLRRRGGSLNMKQKQAHVAKGETDLSSFGQNDVERLQSILASI